MDLGKRVGDVFSLPIRGFCSPMSNGISLPEKTVPVALNGSVLLRHGQSFFRQTGEVVINLHTGVMSAQFAGDDGGGAGTEEWVKNHIAFMRAGKNNSCQEFFRFLGWVIRVLRHGPERDR